MSKADFFLSSSGPFGYQVLAIYYYKIVSAIITRSLIFLLRWEWVHFKVVKGQSCSSAMIACHNYMKGNFGFINLHVRRVVNYSSARCKKSRAEVCREVAVLSTNCTFFLVLRELSHKFMKFTGDNSLSLYRNTNSLLV